MIWPPLRSSRRRSKTKSNKSTSVGVSAVTKPRTEKEGSCQRSTTRQLQAGDYRHATPPLPLLHVATVRHAKWATHQVPAIPRCHSNPSRACWVTRSISSCDSFVDFDQVTKRLPRSKSSSACRRGRGHFRGRDSQRRHYHHQRSQCSSQRRQAREEEAEQRPHKRWPTQDPRCQLQPDRRPRYQRLEMAVATAAALGILCTLRGTRLSLAASRTQDTSTCNTCSRKMKTSDGDLAALACAKRPRVNDGCVRQGRGYEESDY